MKIKDLLWGAFLKILKRWTRANIFIPIHEHLSSIEPNAHILSIGGFGSIDNLLRENLKNSALTLRTFDIDEKHKPDLLGDVQELSKLIPPGSKRPDLIIALEVFEHVPSPKDAIFECFKSLNDEGTLIFSTPWITPIHDRPHDYWRITPQAIKMMTLDFKEVKIYARGNQFDSIVALILRGLFSKKLSLKILVALLAPATLFLQKPKLYDHIEEIDSAIGFTAVCRK